MRDRQHVWVSADATSYEANCEACEAKRDESPTAYAVTRSRDSASIEGTLRSDADVGFTTCWRGHRVVVRRLGRPGPKSNAA